MRDNPRGNMMTGAEAMVRMLRALSNGDLGWIKAGQFGAALVDVISRPLIEVSAPVSERIA